MAQNEGMENRNERGSFFSLGIFKRTSRIARKSAPLIPPKVAASLFEGNPSEDSTPESEDEFPETGECDLESTQLLVRLLIAFPAKQNAKPNTTPSRQLRRESRSSGNLPHEEDAVVESAETTHQIQPSSPSKSVHFVDEVEEDQGVVEEHAPELSHRLRSSKSQPQPAKGKLRHPTAQAPTPHSGEGDELTMSAPGPTTRSRVNANLRDMDDVPMQTRSRSAALRSLRAHKDIDSTHNGYGEEAPTVSASYTGKRAREEDETNYASTARSSRRLKRQAAQRTDGNDEPLFVPQSNGSSHNPQNADGRRKQGGPDKNAPPVQQGESQGMTFIDSLISRLVGTPRVETKQPEQPIDDGQADDPDYGEEEEENDAESEAEENGQDEEEDYDELEIEENSQDEEEEYVESAEESGEEEDSESEAAKSGMQQTATVERLYGQQSALDDIFKHVRSFRKDKKSAINRGKLRSIKIVSKLCKQTASNYKTLRQLSENGDTSPAEAHELESTLPALLNAVSALNPDHKKSSEDSEDLAAQIYLFIFPALVDVLRQASRYYTSLLAEDDTDEQISLDALNSLATIYNIIDRLDQNSRLWKTKPSPRLRVVLPVRYRIIAPLRASFVALQRSTKKARIREEEIKATQEIAANKRRKLLEDLVESNKASIRYKKIDRLRALYLERMAVEPDIRRRLSYLRMPKLNKKLREIDSNGEEFERMPLFGTRVAPHMPEFLQVEGEEWADDERRALIEGLEKFNGENDDALCELTY